jgi:hypothetical protein
MDTVVHLTREIMTLLIRDPIIDDELVMHDYKTMKRLLREDPDIPWFVMFLNSNFMNQKLMKIEKFRMDLDGKDFSKEENISSLPDDILGNIVEFLSPTYLYEFDNKFAAVSKLFSNEFLRHMKKKREKIDPVEQIMHRTTTYNKYGIKVYQYKCREFSL